MNSRPAGKGISALWRGLSERPAGHLRALDGLRALAILLVVATHTAAAFRGAGGAETALLRFPLIQGGWVGVPLFFTLSGFLIGRQLWSELATHGRVDAPRFLLRRGLRIWPLYFLLLALFSFLPTPHGTPAVSAWPEWLFLSNYQPGPLIRADWSLATEEQFYLAAALLFGVAGRHLLPGKRFVLICLALLTLAPLSRALAVHLAGPAVSGDVMWQILHLYRPLHTHFDGLVGGLLIARCLATTPGVAAGATPRIPWVGILTACLIVAGMLRFAAPLVFTYTALSLVFGALVWMAASGAGGWGMRFLSSTPLHVVSKLSYGIYLLHERLLPGLSDAMVTITRGLPGALQFGVLLGVTVAACLLTATVTYLVIERPFLDLRGRWSRTRTA